MNAAEVIQALIERNNARRYLEIGVFKGETFLAIKVPHKTGVDPCFRMQWWRKRLWPRLRHPFQSIVYREVTSNEYFRAFADEEKFDVIFVDGLHTYEQALQDILDATELLLEGGAIVAHDCNPPHAAAAYPAKSFPDAVAVDLDGWSGDWCGDAWKAICHLRSLRHDLNVFTLDCDFGLGVVTRGAAEAPLDLTEDNLQAMTYEDLEKDRANLLNLKPAEYISEFLNTIR